MTIVCLVVFARFSGPRPLALLAAGSAVVAVVNAVSTLGVEFVVPVAPVEELRCLYRRAVLALVASTAISFGASVGVMLWIGQPWWVGAVISGGVVGVALGQFLGAAIVRHGRIVLIGTYRCATAISAATAQGAVLALGEARSPWGLFTAYVVGNAVVSAVFAFYVAPSLRAEALQGGRRARASFDHLRAAAASLLNVGALQGPSIAWPVVLGPSLAGQWALLGRVMNAPASLATGPFSNSFVAETSSLIREDERAQLPSALGKWRKLLFGYGFVTAFMTATVVLLMPFGLGSEWARMRLLVPLGFVYAVSQCAISPTGQLLNLLSRSDVQLKWDVARAGVIGIALVAVPRGLSMLVSYAILMVAFYGLLHAVMSRQAMKFTICRPAAQLSDVQPSAAP